MDQNKGDSTMGKMGAFFGRSGRVMVNVFVTARELRKTVKTEFFYILRDGGKMVGDGGLLFTFTEEYTSAIELTESTDPVNFCYSDTLRVGKSEISIKASELFTNDPNRFEYETIDLKEMNGIDLVLCLPDKVDLAIVRESTNRELLEFIEEKYQLKDKIQIQRFDSEAKTEKES